MKLPLLIRESRYECVYQQYGVDQVWYADTSIKSELLFQDFTAPIQEYINIHLRVERHHQDIEKYDMWFRIFGLGWLIAGTLALYYLYYSLTYGKRWGYVIIFIIVSYICKKISDLFMDLGKRTVEYYGNALDKLYRL